MEVSVESNTVESSASTKLRIFCENVENEIKNKSWGWANVPHHSNVKTLKVSAQEGCQLCELVLEGLATHPHGTLGWQYSNIYGQKTFTIRVTHGGVGEVSLELFRDRDQGIPSLDAFNFIRARSIFVYPVEAISRLVIPWITACMETHEKCRQPRTSPLPTRTLQLRDDDNNVYLKDARGTAGTYTILTHSWGMTPTMTTTSETIDEMQRGISCQALPPTFRDAVKVSRLLGVKNLWIDSLCIVQDSISDWASESSKMLEYYQNAYATISARDGENSFSGFLHPRNDMSIRISAQDNLWLRRRTERDDTAYSKSVLDTRAWCMQERMLSTRIIHFGKAEVIWECQSNHQRESTSESSNIATSFAIGENIAPEEFKRALMYLDNDHFGKTGGLKLWYNIVEQYSKKSLTRVSDILPAISGISSRIQKHTGHTYMYGLWREDLNRGLLWQNRGHGEITGTPSWSWAAMAKVVKFLISTPYKGLHTPRLEIQGAANGGRELILRGRCRQIRCSKRRVETVEYSEMPKRKVSCLRRRI